MIYDYIKMISKLDDIIYDNIFVYPDKNITERLNHFMNNDYEKLSNAYRLFDKKFYNLNWYERSKKLIKILHKNNIEINIDKEKEISRLYYQGE